MSARSSKKQLAAINSPDALGESADTDKETSRSALLLKQESYSGMFPHPSIVEGYEKLEPGAANRILTLIEQQSQHRREQESKMVDAEIEAEKKGILYSFVLGIGCIATAIIIPIAVPNTAGAFTGPAFGATGLVSMVITFINATRNRDDKK